MKIVFCSLGKPHESFVKEGIEMFTKRISNYFPIDWQIIPIPKNAHNLDPVNQKLKEGELVLNTLQKDDFLVLLDERGKILTCEKLAAFIEQCTIDRVKKIVFLIGGAFGVSDAVKHRANFSWSLSSLVFPHQLVRLILAEQVYRACTILKNEQYHHA
jgi:23S rRNA (pseudouridine1915-N3)-methyltransferase